MFNYLSHREINDYTISADKYWPCWDILLRISPLYLYTYLTLCWGYNVMHYSYMECCNIFFSFHQSLRRHNVWNTHENVSPGNFLCDPFLEAIASLVVTFSLTHSVTQAVFIKFTFQSILKSFFTISATSKPYLNISATSHIK